MLDILNILEQEESNINMNNLVVLPENYNVVEDTIKFLAECSYNDVVFNESCNILLESNDKKESKLFKFFKWIGKIIKEFVKKIKDWFSRVFSGRLSKLKNIKSNISKGSSVKNKDIRIIKKKSIDKVEDAASISLLEYFAFPQFSSVADLKRHFGIDKIEAEFNAKREEERKKEFEYYNKKHSETSEEYKKILNDYDDMNKILDGLINEYRMNESTMDDINKETEQMMDAICNKAKEEKVKYNTELSRSVSEVIKVVTGKSVSIAPDETAIFESLATIKLSDEDYEIINTTEAEKVVNGYLEDLIKIVNDHKKAFDRDVSDIMAFSNNIDKLCNDALNEGDAGFPLLMSYYKRLWTSIQRTITRYHSSIETLINTAQSNIEKAGNTIYGGDKKED